MREIDRRFPAAIVLVDREQAIVDHPLQHMCELGGIIGRSAQLLAGHVLMADRAHTEHVWAPLVDICFGPVAEAILRIVRSATVGR